jgi:hypothetical protein
LDNEESRNSVDVWVGRNSNQEMRKTSMSSLHYCDEISPNEDSNEERSLKVKMISSMIQTGISLGLLRMMKEDQLEDE